MKVIMLAVGLWVALLGAPVTAATNSASLVQVDTKDHGYTNMAIRVVELERDTKISKIRVTITQRGSSVGGSMFIMRACSEIAKARGTEYFIVLGGEDDHQGGTLMIVGFTNTKDADLKQEFGDRYSYENESGQKRGYMSVSQLKMIYGQQKESVVPSASTNGATPRR